MSYQRNIQTYTLYRFFFGMLIIGPVIMPYFRWKGLNYTEIMWLQSIAALSYVIFELPTGVVADKISRKLSLMLAGTCIGFALTIYIQTHSFYTFAIAEALFGLGFTFGSGADSALLYESLDRIGQKDDYARIEGRATAYLFAGQGVGAIASSLLYAIDPNLPFGVSVGSVFIAAALTWRFIEPERVKSTHRYHTHVVKSLGLAMSTPRIFWVICLAALMGISYRSAFWLYEPYFTHVHIDVVWFGSIFFFFNVIAALSAKYLVYYLKKHRTALLGMGLLLAFSFAWPALVTMPISIIIIGLQQIVRGTYRPTLNSYINRQIQDEYRATIISIIGLSANLSFACFSPLVGLSLDRYGAIPTYWLLSGFTLIGTLLLFWMRHLQDQKQPTQNTEAMPTLQIP